MASTKSKKSRKGLAVGLAILGVAGLSLASASQLTLKPGQLQAGVDVVGACQGTLPVTVSFADPALNATTGEYQTSSATLSGIAAACYTPTSKYKIAVIPTTGTPVEQTGNVTGASITVTLPAATDAKLVSKISLTIYS